MNKKEFDKTEREPVDKKDFLDALGEILLFSEPIKGSENREPTNEELSQRYKLTRKKESEG